MSTALITHKRRDTASQNNQQPASTEKATFINARIAEISKDTEGISLRLSALCPTANTASMSYETPPLVRGTVQKTLNILNNPLLLPVLCEGCDSEKPIEKAQKISSQFATTGISLGNYGEGSDLFQQKVPLKDESTGPLAIGPRKPPGSRWFSQTAAQPVEIRLSKCSDNLSDEGRFRTALSRGNGTEPLGYSSFSQDRFMFASEIDLPDDEPDNMDAEGSVEGNENTVNTNHGGIRAAARTIEGIQHTAGSENASNTSYIEPVTEVMEDVEYDVAAPEREEHTHIDPATQNMEGIQSKNDKDTEGARDTQAEEMEDIQGNNDMDEEGFSEGVEEILKTSNVTTAGSSRGITSRESMIRPLDDTREGYAVATKREIRDQDNIEKARSDTERVREIDMEQAQNEPSEGSTVQPTVARPTHTPPHTQEAPTQQPFTCATPWPARECWPWSTERARKGNATHHVGFRRQRLGMNQHGSSS